MLAIVALATAVIGATGSATITHHQTATHPMRYHVALPEGWTPDRTWPVVVVIADAHRDFVANLERFVAVRGARPFVLVAPEVLTCGGTRGQTTPPYSYTEDEWRGARAIPDFDFDDAGLAAVLAEVHRKWHGEERAFLTGWEAGGHTVWAQTFRRPERWRGVAPVTTNYQGRGVDTATFSNSPERTTLPIQVFFCGAPTGDVQEALLALRQQTDRALAEARARGFDPSPVREVPGADHGPLPEAVLVWFDSLTSAKHGG